MTAARLIADDDCAAWTGAIAAMTSEAFSDAHRSGDGEAALIAALRSSGDAVTELAAVTDDGIVGHVMFSRLMDDPVTNCLAALAPVCAKVGHQRAGIGTALIRAGLERCRAKGIRAVIVLGSTAYYGRFGFDVEPVKHIACPYAGPYLQGLEFEPGVLASVRSATYPPAFDGV